MNNSKTPIVDEEVINDKVETINYSCNNCGNEMVFDPESQTLKCSSCNHKIVFDNNFTDIVENSFFEAIQKENSLKISPNTLVNEVECKNCGATIVYKDNIFANKCIYCGSSNVLEHEEAEYLKPEYLIPFKISKTKSNDLVNKWCKHNFFMNKTFKDNISVDNLYGVYIPYWTYDSDTTTHYTALRGVHYYVTKTRTVNGKKETYQQVRTRWYPVSGTHQKFFDDILIPGVHNTDDINYSTVIHFNLEELVGYNEQYITGFYAKKYDLDIKTGWNDAKVIAKNELKYEIERRIGGDVVSALKMNTNYDNITYKHILLPLWIYTYNYKDNVYNFLINGQTGKIHGKYPLNWFRVIMVTIIAILCFISLYYGIGYAINS